MSPRTYTPRLLTAALALLVSASTTLKTDYVSPAVREPAIRARGIGNPWVSYEDGESVAPLPIDRNGVTDDMVQVSPSVSIVGLPTGATLDLELRLDLQIDSLLPATDDAVTVYRWNDDHWEARPTVANTRFQIASVDIEAAGTYVAFLDPEKATAVAVEDDLGTAPGKTSLDISNFPNPFVTSTVIRFMVPEAGHVSLSVFNALGQKVRELVNDDLPAGSRQAVFDAEGLPAGLYISRFALNGKEKTAKIIKVN